MRAIVSSALLLLSIIFLTVVLSYRCEGMCGCNKRPFYVGYEGFAGPMGQLYPKLDYRSSEGFQGPKAQLYPNADLRSAEGFGTSPGTMTQLATSHVPTEADVPILKQWLADRKQGVYMMTQEDLDHGAPMTPLRIGAFN
jgi:hypothetical protein